MTALSRQPRRLAIIVSHPIQYYVPLYQRLARRDDVTIKVFYTWHAGTCAVFDTGFQREVDWDIPLNEGYDHELVPNTARHPGTHHFRGLTNPSLFARVASWQPDVVHITGWAWRSHLEALWRFHRARIPTLFRGDSHLLDGRPRGLRGWFKEVVLRRVFSWPKAFLYVGTANRAYYTHFGVDAARLYYCPHAIDVRRFAEPATQLEVAATAWRQELGIPETACAVLFAGKFEKKKQPLTFMQAILAQPREDIVGIMVGGGELEPEVRAIADANPSRFFLLAFQNQSKMPLVYRLGDLFVLPSLYGETWGLAVNECLASGRPVLVSNKVGCAGDLVDQSVGAIFDVFQEGALRTALDHLTEDRIKLMGMRHAARARGGSFDVSVLESSLTECLFQVVHT